MGRIITFTGASGVGKDSVARVLGLPRVVSVTTRARRSSDVDGEYTYVDDEEFQQMVVGNYFIWEAGMRGKRYGTMFFSINKVLVSEKDHSMILTPDVIPRLRRYAGIENVVSFYIASPSEKILRDRLVKRGDSVESIERSIAECAAWEDRARVSDIPYYFIKNEGVLDDAVERVKEYLQK